ncbi:unnamed protein product [Vitrella brassicaformis CCMP3155]|uniref:Uncharacterized protein n=1 Tax=Vitrella brassicaformis (strain CCMP3155) TaxID=1169540 RepID=A0A0G4F5L9_VITBC|nr:unnamed protein product [Vitrella brassicaformis CCMP3155]|eukprot:CEM07780.1 unnamed protein product [Vitrella brassicaformis CCMP3155]
MATASCLVAACRSQARPASPYCHESPRFVTIAAISPSFDDHSLVAMSSRPANGRPPTAPLVAVPPLRSAAISKAADMAMSADPNRRAALHLQINGSNAGEVAEILMLVEQHIDKAISRLGLADVLAFDIGGDVGAGLKVVYVLERGSGEEWRAMGRFLRMAFIYRLTPANATRPLQLSADSLPTAAAFHQLPLAMAIYKIIGHLLTHHTHSLALQHADNGAYRIGNESFRVVPLDELPSGHRYAEGYKRTDPVIRWGALFSRSFSAYLMARLLSWWSGGEGVSHRKVVHQLIDRRYDRLRGTDAITEDQGIAVDYRCDGGHLNAGATDRRYVIVSGFRPGETVAAHLQVSVSTTGLWIGYDIIMLRTTEAPGADRSHPLAHRFPISEPLCRRVLRRFGLESDVIDRGRVVG